MAGSNSASKNKVLALLDEAKTMVRGSNRKAIETAIRVIKDESKTELTKLLCDHLKADANPLRDTICQGLRLQPRKKGNVWIYRYSWEGKQPEIKYGTYPEVTLAQAREMWHRDNDLLRQGKQPATCSSSSGMTVDQLCRQYLNLAEKHKRSWKEDQRQINFDILPAWKNRIASEITYDDANKLITEVYETRNSPRSAEKLVALGRFIFNLATGNITKAKRKQWFTPSFNTRINPWFEIKKNPFADVELPEREENSCVLKGKDLKSYLRNFDTATFSNDAYNVLKLQLWCNTRISEPAQMDWNEIDLEDGIWTIPKDRTKTKAELDVMLPTQAIELLLSLEPKDSGYVFAFNGIRRENIVTHIAEQIRNNRKHLGVPDNFSSHSLRHTGQTLLASMECPVEVRDRVSNHKPNKKTNMSAKYDSHEYDKSARIWLQSMADKLDELAIPNIVHIGDRDAN